MFVVGHTQKEAVKYIRENRLDAEVLNSPERLMGTHKAEVRVLPSFVLRAPGQKLKFMNEFERRNAHVVYV